MEKLIEQYKEKKAQISGAILEEERYKISTTTNVFKGADYIQILEAQAELYQAMIELAQEFIKLTNK